MTARGTCWRCKWFDRDGTDAEGEGFCRRYPPGTIPLGDGDVAVQMWPSVEFLDWCGEYQDSEV